MIRYICLSIATVVLLLVQSVFGGLDIQTLTPDQLPLGYTVIRIADQNPEETIDTLGVNERNLYGPYSIISPRVNKECYSYFQIVWRDTVLNDPDEDSAEVRYQFIYGDNIQDTIDGRWEMYDTLTVPATVPRSIAFPDSLFYKSIMFSITNISDATRIENDIEVHFKD